MALSEFSGDISSYYLDGKVWNYFSNKNFVISSIILFSPIPAVPVFYIDGSALGKGCITGSSLSNIVHSTYKSVQQEEFGILFHLLSYVSELCKMMIQLTW